MKQIIRFLFVFVVIYVTCYYTTPLLEELTGEKVEILNLLWFAQLCFMIPIAYALYSIYDKYFGK